MAPLAIPPPLGLTALQIVLCVVVPLLFLVSILLGFVVYHNMNVPVTSTVVEESVVDSANVFVPIDIKSAEAPTLQTGFSSDKHEARSVAQTANARALTHFVDSDIVKSPVLQVSCMHIPTSVNTPNTDVSNPTSNTSDITDEKYLQIDPVSPSAFPIHPLVQEDQEPIETFDVDSIITLSCPSSQQSMACEIDTTDSSLSSCSSSSEHHTSHDSSTSDESVTERSQEDVTLVDISSHDSLQRSIKIKETLSLPIIVVSGPDGNNISEDTLFKDSPLTRLSKYSQGNVSRPPPPIFLDVPSFCALSPPLKSSLVDINLGEAIVCSRLVSGFVEGLGIQVDSNKPVLRKTSFDSTQSMSSADSGFINIRDLSIARSYHRSPSLLASQTWPSLPPRPSAPTPGSSSSSSNSLQSIGSCPSPCISPLSSRWKYHNRQDTGSFVDSSPIGSFESYVEYVRARRDSHNQDGDVYSPYPSEDSWRPVKPLHRLASVNSFDSVPPRPSAPTPGSSIGSASPQHYSRFDPCHSLHRAMKNSHRRVSSGEWLSSPSGSLSSSMRRPHRKQAPSRQGSYSPCSSSLHRRQFSVASALSDFSCRRRAATTDSIDWSPPSRPRAPTPYKNRADFYEDSDESPRTNLYRRRRARTISSRASAGSYDIDSRGSWRPSASHTSLQLPTESPRATHNLEPLVSTPSSLGSPVPTSPINSRPTSFQMRPESVYDVDDEIRFRYHATRRRDKAYPVQVHQFAFLIERIWNGERVGANWTPAHALDVLEGHTEDSKRIRSEMARSALMYAEDGRRAVRAMTRNMYLHDGFVEGIDDVFEGEEGEMASPGEAEPDWEEVWMRRREKAKWVEESRSEEEEFEWIGRLRGSVSSGESVGEDETVEGEGENVSCEDEDASGESNLSAKTNRMSAKSGAVVEEQDDTSCGFDLAETISKVMRVAPPDRTWIPPNHSDPWMREQMLRHWRRQMYILDVEKQSYLLYPHN